MGKNPFYLQVLFARLEASECELLLHICLFCFVRAVVLLLVHLDHDMILCVLFSWCWLHLVQPPSNRAFQSPVFGLQGQHLQVLHLCRHSKFFHSLLSLLQRVHRLANFPQTRIWITHNTHCPRSQSYFGVQNMPSQHDAPPMYCRGEVNGIWSSEPHVSTDLLYSNHQTSRTLTDSSLKCCR